MSTGKPALRRQYGNSLRALLALGLLLLALAAVHGQEEPEPGEKPPEKKGEALRARPEDDPQAARFVANLAAVRPVMASAPAQPVARHVLSPDGKYLYYFRNLNGEPPKPRTTTDAAPKRAPRYVLFRVSPGGSEERVLETGFDALPPLFLPEGRLAVVTRLVDLNGDGTVNHLDDRALVTCGADGAGVREAALLRPSESPLAVWRDGRDVLLADFARDDINGWIVSLALGQSQRTPITRGFNVSMVLDDGRLLVERFVPPPPPPAEPFNPWMARMRGDGGLEDADPPPVASVLDTCVHVIFNPADGRETELYRPTRRARICAQGEGGFFGYIHQRRELGFGRIPWGGFRAGRSLETFQILIVDSPTQSDARAPLERNSYLPLAWIAGAGLLATEISNLKTRLVLMDRSSQFNLLPITELDFDAQGFCASSDGSTVAWLAVEDSNEDGQLDSWRDNCRVWFLNLTAR